MINPIIRIQTASTTGYESNDHQGSKPEVVLANGGVAVAHCRSESYVYGLVYRLVRDLEL